MSPVINFSTYYFQEIKKCNDFTVKNLVFLCIIVSAVANIIFFSMNNGNSIINLKTPLEYMFVISTCGMYIGITGMFIKCVINLYDNYKKNTVEGRTLDGKVVRMEKKY